MVYLHIDGVKQTPGKPTGADGCASWSGLQPGKAYAVEEDVNGWQPLTPTSHNFGILASDQSVSFTFINKQVGIKIYLPLLRK